MTELVNALRNLGVQLPSLLDSNPGLLMVAADAADELERLERKIAAMYKYAGPYLAGFERNADETSAD